MDDNVLSRALVEKVSDTENIARWLGHFERALHARDRAALMAMFADECHWRDLVALTWSIAPHAGQASIAERLLATDARNHPRNFRVAVDRTPPRRVKRIGEDVIEGIFEFETDVSRGLGVLRLLQAQPDRACVLNTSLHELKGHEEAVNERRPHGAAYSREFGGDNWSDRRAKEQAFTDRDPAVLIIGAGQSGLSIAARLRLLGVDALCVDKLPRVGDIWRQRYHSLALHNQVGLNHMAYMPFPPSWPKYLPKDMVANWIENYAWAMECNVWTSTSFLQGEYDEAAGHWNARVRRADGSERVLKPRHIVFANGIVGAPKMPDAPGLDEFAGPVIHTHGYMAGDAWKGKKALVLGAGTSGHDIAQDLHGHGADVKMIQRGPITIVSVEAATMAYTLYYDEDIPLEDCDLIATSSTFPMALKGAQMLARRMQDYDRDLITRLETRGFKMDLGEDGGGYQIKVRRSHSGYYLNCGCSDLIADGQIGLVQYEDIERFVPEGALMKDGRVEKADLVVAATGYQSQQEVVREFLGDAIADKVGPIWGLDVDGELCNMYRPTVQKGLWFIGSGLSQARIYSKFIALQIKAREVGIVA